MNDAPISVHPRQADGPEPGRQRAPRWALARLLWIAAAVVGVVGNGVNCLLARSQAHATDEFAAAVGQAALFSALLGLAVAVVLAVAFSVLGVVLGRGWSPARWLLGVLGLVAIAVATQNLAGGWLMLATSAIQIVVIVAAFVAMLRTPRGS